MRELYKQAHEELIEIYLEQHPEASEDEACEKTADAAYERMRDNLADMADRAKDRMKEEGNWPPKQPERKPL